MDMLDWVTAVLTVMVLVASLLFPINPDEDAG